MTNEGTDDYLPDPKKEELFEELSRRYEREKQNREKHVVELELTPELEQTGIVERYAYYAETNAIHILLNHQYMRKSIVFSVYKNDWNKTHNIFEKQLKQKGISKEHIHSSLTS
jgi:superfamily II DNA/RNA helicase